MCFIIGEGGRKVQPRRNGGEASLAQSCALVAGGIRSQRQEVERAIHARFCAGVPGAPPDDCCPEYEKGLRVTVSAVVGYCLEAIEGRPHSQGPVPRAAVTQARLAARCGVDLGIVQRRYIVGHAKLGELIGREAERSGVACNGRVVNHLRRTQESVLEYLTAVVEREYLREPAGARREQRLAGVARRVLEGGSVETIELAELGYELHARWHVAVVAVGGEIRGMVRALDGCGVESLRLSSDTSAWLWYGARRCASVEAVERLAAAERSGAVVGIGEPGLGLEGWRLTHQQARAALGVALHKPERIARYADHRLMAAALRDETLAKSLAQRYTVLLGSQRDGGAKLRKTLRALIDAGCVASAAASALAVDRHTVEDRVRTAERLFGCSLRGCLAELDVALRLQELDGLSR